MYTRTELADLYGVSPNTFAKRLKAIGIKGRERITPKQLTLIIEELGMWNDKENDFTIFKPKT